MASQESTNKHVVEDFSNPNSVPSTRSAVAASNPLVGGSIDPEYLAAAQRSAQQHITDVRAQLAEQDQSEQHPTVPESGPQIPQVPQAASQQPEKSPTLQSDLSLLATTGRIENEAIVGGYKFKLRTLTARENNEVLAITGGVIQDFTQLGYMRIEVLSRAIETVNGVPLENLYEGTEELNTIDKKKAIVENWQLPMLTRLFDTYNEMLRKSEELFGDALESGEIKN